MPERQFFSDNEKQKKRLIALGVVLVLIVICFVARHFIGDWLRTKKTSPKREMIVTTTDAMDMKKQLSKLSPHNLYKLGRAMRPKIAEEITLANKVPSDKPVQANEETTSPSASNTDAKPDNTVQQKPLSPEQAGDTISPEKIPEQNATDILPKQLEVEAFSIPIAGRRFAVFRYHYPAVHINTISHGVVVYGYSGETLKRISCYHRYPVSLASGACADEIEKVFHVHI